MAPLDAAIYDIMAKSAGLPVYKFLGGYRDSVPVYVTGGYYREGKGIPELLTEVQGYVDQGINAIKLKVGALHERLVTSHSAWHTPAMTIIANTYPEARTTARIDYRLEQVDKK